MYSTKIQIQWSSGFRRGNGLCLYKTFKYNSSSCCCKFQFWLDTEKTQCSAIMYKLKSNISLASLTVNCSQRYSQKSIDLFLRVVDATQIEAWKECFLPETIMKAIILFRFLANMVHLPPLAYPLGNWDFPNCFYFPFVLARRTARIVRMIRLLIQNCAKNHSLIAGFNYGSIYDQTKSWSSQLYRCSILLSSSCLNPYSRY